MDLGLRGRRALVTGGSKGIGYAVAEELVREGAHVAICARHQDEVDAAAAQLRADLDATPPRSPVSSPSWPATGPATSPGLDRRGRRDGPLRLSRPGGEADVPLADALTAKQS
jgi:NAD(P)-dependent dehydrogenase (short-subunit alcohol dehydrogenase family)